MIVFLPRKVSGKEPPPPEPDRFADAPHPREMLSLLGHKGAEAEFLEAYRHGRLHHAWLIAGPEGVGKATLAYRMARFVLANPDPASPAVRDAVDLSVYSESSVAHLIAADAHPDLAIVRRGLSKTRKDLMTETSVDYMRKGLEVFEKTAAYGGWRIAIVDACDDLNASSANALLKTLEEPPAKSLLLLVAHQPGRLLPTIRSRCRLLRLRALEPADVAEVTMALPDYDKLADDLHLRAATIGEGSVRRALSVLDPKRLSFHDRVEAILESLPRFNPGEVDAIAELTQGRTGLEAFEHFCERCETWLARQLHGRAGDLENLALLSEVWDKLGVGRRDVDVYNLDRRPFVIAMVSDLAFAARMRA
jgi:DNA polymerase-3 subunit delta'